MWPECYIEVSERSSQEKVHCMRCNTIVLDQSYEMQPKRNNPTEQIAVLAPRKHSNYRLVPFLTERDLRNSVTHLILCVDCENFELTEDLKVVIIEQILTALMLQAKWAGYPEEACNSIREKWRSTRLVKRLSKAEMSKFYSQKELQNVSNI